EIQLDQERGRRGASGGGSVIDDQVRERLLVIGKLLVVIAALPDERNGDRVIRDRVRSEQIVELLEAHQGSLRGARQQAHQRQARTLIVEHRDAAAGV